MNDDGKFASCNLYRTRRYPGMQPNIKWLDDPRVFRVGLIDAHSDHL